MRDSHKRAESEWHLNMNEMENEAIRILSY